MRNAILGIRRAAGDSPSMPQLHRLSLTMMLPPRAVRRLNKTIGHQAHRTLILMKRLGSLTVTPKAVRRLNKTIGHHMR
jgi:hypothetical protein